MITQILRAPLLLPQPDRTVAYIPEGAIAGDEAGRVAFIGLWKGLKPQLSTDSPQPRVLKSVVLPPFLDIHTHISQHPIRGRFTDGISDDAPGGRLLAGLQRNVFPAEGRCADEAQARAAIDAFARDTLAHGVVGGIGWMTVHAAATRMALEALPSTWSVGFVQMLENCPDYLRTDEANFDRDVADLARQFGHRLVLSDRFAVVTPAPLRQRAADLADQFGLRMQTHLNEQVAEKDLVEKTLYPNRASYTDVYAQDGLLDHRPIVAHCIHMREDELKLLADHGAAVAHCPTSNKLLGSGVMDLEAILDWDLAYALATDVGASPTVSMLAEMRMFLEVHRGLHPSATPSEALFRSTLAPAQILGLEHELGLLRIGAPMSFIEIDPATPPTHEMSADQVIERCLLDGQVSRVWLGGREIDAASA